VNVVVRAVTGALAVALMAAAMWLYGLKPHLQARMQNPIRSTGRAGAVVDTSDFSVKVDKVDVATAIAKTSFGDKPKIMPSLGIFVIVNLEIKSNRKPFDPGHVHLMTRGGVSYDESGRADVLSLNNGYQPMLWAPATYVFEIPKDRLAGARLVVGQTALLDQLSAQADVDLGIGHAAAERLIAHASSAYVLKST
jgi:hypothetical protein